MGTPWAPNTAGPLHPTFQAASRPDQLWGFPPGYEPALPCSQHLPGRNGTDTTQANGRDHPGAWGGGCCWDTSRARVPAITQEQSHPDPRDTVHEGSGRPLLATPPALPYLLLPSFQPSLEAPPPRSPFRPPAPGSSQSLVLACGTYIPSHLASVGAGEVPPVSGQDQCVGKGLGVALPHLMGPSAREMPASKAAMTSSHALRCYVPSRRESPWPGRHTARWWTAR